jgi:hypothetical protein
MDALEIAKWLLGPGWEKVFVLVKAKIEERQLTSAWWVGPQKHSSNDANMEFEAYTAAGSSKKPRRWVQESDMESICCGISSEDFSILASIAIFLIWKNYIQLKEVIRSFDKEDEYAKTIKGMFKDQGNHQLDEPLKDSYTIKNPNGHLVTYQSTPGGNALEWKVTGSRQILLEEIQAHMEKFGQSLKIGGDFVQVSFLKEVLRLSIVSEK